MRITYALFSLILITLSLGSCSGSGNSPGYLFEIIFIIIPLLIIGHYLYKKIETANESLYVIEGQLKRITSKLEELEEKLGKNPDSAKRTKK